MGQLCRGAEPVHLAHEFMTALMPDARSGWRSAWSSRLHKVIAPFRDDAGRETIGDPPRPTGQPKSPHLEQIEVRVGELKQLFNSMDASPFRERDLDPDAEEFIVGWARESLRGAKLALLIDLERAPPPVGVADESVALHGAISAFFTHRARVTRGRLRQLLRIGRVSLLVGLAFLIAAVGIGDFIASAMKEHPLGELLREGLVICGWVAMWRPLEIFLYGWWPLRVEAKLFDRLSEMPVRIAYQGAAEPGADDAWRHDWPAVPPVQTMPQKSPPHATTPISGGAKPVGALDVPERGPIASAVVGPCSPERGTKGGKATP
jgi:hypothetical protein